MRSYTATTNYTPGAAANVALELAASSTVPIQIIGVEVTQQGSTAAAELAVQFRIATGATGGWTSPTTITPYDIGRSGTASVTTVKSYNAAGTSTDGTGSTVVRQYGMDVRAGLYWSPIPQAQIVVPASDFFVVKFATAPPAGVAFNINVDYIELA